MRVDRKHDERERERESVCVCVSVCPSLCEVAVVDTRIYVHSFPLNGSLSIECTDADDTSIHFHSFPGDTID
jgi:hypothetical protein